MQNYGRGGGGAPRAGASKAAAGVACLMCACVLLAYLPCPGVLTYFSMSKRLANPTQALFRPIHLHVVNNQYRPCLILNPAGTPDHACLPACLPTGLAWVL